MLAYVASGRLLGYVEEHMNAWDCLAGLLLVEEAGGWIVPPDPKTVLEEGTVVIAGGRACSTRSSRFATRPSDCDQHRPRSGKPMLDRLAGLKRRIDIRRDHEDFAEFRADDEFEVAADIGCLLQRAGKRVRALRPDEARCGLVALRAWPVPVCGRGPAASGQRAQTHGGAAALDRGDLAIGRCWPRR